MTGTNHGITGAVVALYVKEPLVAVPLAYLSHFACDAIPHFGVKDNPGQPDNELFGKKFNIILLTDFLVAVSLMALFGNWFPEQKWVIWGCMVAAASPDLAWAYYHLYVEHVKRRKPKLDPVSKFHAWIQWSSSYPGAYVEAVWFVLMGLAVLARR